MTRKRSAYELKAVKKLMVSVDRWTKNNKFGAMKIQKTRLRSTAALVVVDNKGVFGWSLDGKKHRLPQASASQTFGAWGAWRLAQQHSNHLA